jgi:hypothetical protein
MWKWVNEEMSQFAVDHLLISGFTQLFSNSRSVESLPVWANTRRH